MDSAIQRLNDRGLESRVSIHAVTVDYRVDVAVKVSKRARGGQTLQAIQTQVTTERLDRLDSGRVIVMSARVSLALQSLRKNGDYS